MKKPKQMTGALKAPIKIKHTDLLAAYLLGPNSNEAAATARNLMASSISEVSGKIEALASHYKIDSPVDGDPLTAASRYRALLIALASDFVPGFQQPVKKGRPSKWDTLAGQFLILDIERHIVPGDSSRGVSYASAQCAKRGHWQAYVGVTDSDGALRAGHDIAEALRKGYEAANKRPLWLPKNAGQNNDFGLDQAEWDEHVQHVVEGELSRLDGEN